MLIALTSVAVATGGLGVVPSYGVSVSSAVFSGGAGTVSVGGTLYAKQGAALTLTVVTSSDTRCVTITGAATLPRQTSETAKTSWTFTLAAPAGNGAQAFTVTASPRFNSNNCSGDTTTSGASYTLDNTGPVVSAALSPAPNAAGWNNSDVTVRWTAADTGSGVAAAQPFQTDSVTANGIMTLSAPAQSDRLDNKGADGSVTVRVDKAKPTMSGAETRNADGTVTVTFACDDSNSGGGESSGIATCVADGTSPASSSKTVPAGQTVTGTATDKAGNTTTATFTTTPADKTAPTISGSVSPAPNAAGWNKADATVTFSCDDETGGSGLASCVADGTSPASASKTVATETNGTLVSGSATDKAGNTARDSVTVKVDKTAPTLSASKDRAPNAAGWYADDVTVSFSASDALSGVAAKTPNQVLDEGADQSARGTATDAAGNTSATATVSGINVDKTAPRLTGVPTTAPNADGWYNEDVAIEWTASDVLSGLAGAAPADSTIEGQGTGLKVSASITDKAGNTTNADSPAVNIDRTAPNTGISGTSNTWVSGDVTVTLAPTDNLSGVASTKYSLDNGPLQTGTSLKLSTDGDHTLSFFSTDNAGNAETAQTVRVRIDKIAPTIRHFFTPAGYADGAWTNQDVEVSFTCADQGGSGVATCTGDATVSSEGKHQTITGTATDGAGNAATDTALVSIDKTAPSISGAADRRANANGWYNDDVRVSFAASDALSGIASKTGEQVLTQGAAQSVTGTAADAAGNTAGATVSGISIDKTAPTLTGSFPAGWHTGNVTVGWDCADALSGPAGQPAASTVAGEGADLSATASCEDKAGNGTTTTVSGIRIDRTAPATGVTVNGALSNGWYRAGIDVDLTASDNLSGVAKTYYSVDGGAAKEYSEKVSVVEDGTHTFTYWSVDGAGNVEPKTGNSVTLKIDKTPPALTGAATTAYNGNGWYSGDVTVAWTCSDATSGVAGTCPADSTVGGEGQNLGAAASVSDNAGNATAKTVGGINIDRTAPTTTSQVAQAPASGWYDGAVQVTLKAGDNLSGVETTWYTVDGDERQRYDGPFSVGSDGEHSVSFWSADKAGNVEKVGAPLTFRIDRTAPVTGKINPISPDSGWFVTSGIPFAFDAEDGHSGVVATYYTIDGGVPQSYGEPFTADLSTGRHTVNYWSVDVAGNKEPVRSFDLNVDTIAPGIEGSQNPAPNAHGWNNTPVDVTFTCTDDDSGVNGVAGCAGDTKLSNDGAGQKVTGDAVDVAGNRSSIEFGPVNIDQTKPTLAVVPTTDANGAGWYKGDVVVKWVGNDALSGVDPATQPDNSTITDEGRLGAGPVTIKDKAGNTSDPASVSGIKIDRTAPVITGAPTTQPNAAGWYKDKVVVDFGCADPRLADGTDGSGVAACPTSKLLTADGANQSVTSDAAADHAGNASAGKTVGGINIDGSAPATSSDNQCTKTNGWCTGSSANVVLTSTDQTGLSGVKEIRYSINGGTEQVALGATKTVSVPLDGEGQASVKYYAVDKAGNVETPNTVSLKYDNIAPAVSHTLTPKPNADDWNNSDVTVHFDAKDNDAGSGVDASTVTTDVIVSTESAGLRVDGSAKDTAGNLGTDFVVVKLDKTKPTITGVITGGTQGANGWYVGPVSVTFTCSDALSGIPAKGCPDPVTLTANGANIASGTVTDLAGNTATATVSGIKIDREKPTLTAADVNVAGATYTLGAVPAATCTATDDVSGLASCNVATSGGNANGVGTFTYTATATDKAGNTSTLSGTYKVKYRFDGFLQPINDTAHQVGVSTSIFKAGSTVPAKIQLKKADGTLIQGAVATWLTPVKGSSVSAPVDESVYTASADSGTAYRYDATAQQYIYNWKTGSTAGNYWRIGVTLDDGQTYYVNIGLR